MESSLIQSKLHMVDLAGSERAKRTQATGARLKESVGINQVRFNLIDSTKNYHSSRTIYVIIGIASLRQSDSGTDTHSIYHTVSDLAKRKQRVE